MAALLISLAPGPPCAADQIRIAYFQTELSRDGPGLLLRDLIRGGDSQVEAVLEVVAIAKPDVLVLGGFDFDHDWRALTSLRDQLANHGLEFPHVFSEQPNSGLQLKSGLDPYAANEFHSFGPFRGSHGMAILSSLPFKAPPDSLTSLIWTELPWANPPLAPDVRPVLRLSSHNHWLAQLALPGGQSLSLLTLHASAPVFDGPEDLNGHRNADEIRLWSEVLDGWRPASLSSGQVVNPVVVGTLNADPLDGESRPGAVDALLQHASLQDPKPRSRGAIAKSAEDGGVNVQHRTDPAFDTVDWLDDRADSPGNLRVDYILPSRTFDIVASGVLWPEGDQPELLETVRLASRHRLIWVDLALR